MVRVALRIARRTAASVARGIAAGVLVAGCRGSEPPRVVGAESAAMPVALARPAFILTGTDGKPVNFAARTAGMLTFLEFGYTNCPDVCPTTMAKLGQVMRLLGADANQVQGLFVTVDPKRDTPQLLAQYVPAFFPTFIGLYGSDQQTASAAKEFKVYFQAQKPGASGFYTVDHSGPVFALDRKGRRVCSSSPR